MDVKQFLQQVRRQGARIRSLSENLDRLRYDMTHLSSPILGDKVQTSHQSSLDDVLIRMEAEEEVYLAEYKSLLYMRREAVRLISMEPDPVCQAVLQRRYIMGQRWEEISAAMNYSSQHIRRLNDQALWNLEKMSRNEQFFCGTI